VPEIVDDQVNQYKCIIISESTKNKKLATSRAFALRDCESGKIIMVGIPENIIGSVRTRKDLKIISTEAGDHSWGLRGLYEENKIAKQ